MSRPNSAKLVARLQRDLAELHDSPYPGVAVFTDDANMRRICLVLTPPSGPWKNLALHFVVEIPDAWPAAPPSIQSSTHINHPNLFDSYICCDLLKTQNQIYAESGYTGGYTPALTLRGLFLQFLTFFSSTSIEQDMGHHYYVGDYLEIAYVDEVELQGHIRSISLGLMPNHGQNRNKKLKANYERNTNKEIPIHIYHSSCPILLSHKTKNTHISTQRIHRLEYRSPRWTSTLKSISTWTCDKCIYGSASLPHHSVSQRPHTTEDTLLYLIPGKTCVLDDVPDDILYVLAPFLPSESVLSFSEVYPRFRAIVSKSRELLRRELQCFFLRTPLYACVLGVGVALNTRARTVTSDFDWLSEEAFEQFAVRQGVEKRRFDFFLPLPFSRGHFESAQRKICDRLQRIYKAIIAETNNSTNMRARGGHRRQQPIVRAPPTASLRFPAITVVYRMMNNIVVGLMKSCDDVVAEKFNSNTSLLFASEKAVYSYCHLFHLLISLSRTDPTILSDASKIITSFISDSTKRTKTQVPDLGEFIVMVTLVMACTDGIKWEQLGGLFLEEVITRNVRWVLKDSPDLEILEKETSQYRISVTFFHSKTSLRLIMFQVAFLQMFVDTYSSNMALLDDNYGFAEKNIPQAMVTIIKDIYQVKDWPTFFQKVKYEHAKTWTSASFSAILRDGVSKSAELRYHEPTVNHGDMDALAQIRRKRDLSWMGANGTHN